MRAGGAERIEQALQAAIDTNRPAIAAFVTAGYPTMESFPGTLSAVAGAADIVEVGVPFSDPMADGVTIQRSSRKALENGVTLAWILDVIGSSGIDTPVVLMSYLNPLLAFGLEVLAREAVRFGVAGLIVPDLPFEEAARIRQPFDDLDIALIQLVTPVTLPDRLNTLCRASRGFVYAVTSTGTTGRRGGEERPAAAYLESVRSASSVPVMAGFGVRTADQVRSLFAHADGVIVGSALIELLESGNDPVRFLTDLVSEPSERKATE